MMFHSYSEQAIYFLNQTTMQSNELKQPTDMTLVPQEEQKSYVDLAIQASKRKQSLERNRLAAYRCREKKKNEQQKMIEQARYLEAKNELLNTTTNKLKNEVIRLKELMLAHDICDCKDIHSFIRKSSTDL
ncbi:hypothetical protein BD560DRAFT_394700 [Blakeslea trispora]|nr:hypothetical protein BD560DRAFT_394700 [Blakeslea trispora]